MNYLEAIILGIIQGFTEFLPISSSGHLEIVKTILDRNKMKPFCLVAKTIKGYPVSFMKNNPIWHYRSPSKNEFLIAMDELKK